MALKDLQQRIGPVHYASPRAVRVNAGTDENIAATRAAVYGSIAVYVETQAERDAILSLWPQIINEAAEKAAQILSVTRNGDETPPV